MSQYIAVQMLEKALDRTKDLLWPPHISIWSRLLIITLILGGGISIPFPDDVLTSSFSDRFFHTEDGIGTLLVYIGIGFACILFLYAFFSALFQFVLVDCLITNQMTIMHSLSHRIKMGVSLLSFYLCIIFLIIGIMGSIFFMYTLPILHQESMSMQNLIITFLFTVLILCIFLIPLWIAIIYATDFVVPIMMIEDTHVWRGFIRSFLVFSGQKTDVMLFMLIKIGICIITGVVLGICGTIIDASIRIIFLLVKNVDFCRIPFMETIVFLFVMMIFSLIFLTPIITFLRYYSLLVLEQIHPAYSLLPEKH